MKTTPWEGVRNAEARNLMKEMRVGDKVSIHDHLLSLVGLPLSVRKVLFYHSNCKNPGTSARVTA